MGHGCVPDETVLVEEHPWGPRGWDRGNHIGIPPSHPSGDARSVSLGPQAHLPQAILRTLQVTGFPGLLPQASHRVCSRDQSGHSASGECD